MYRSYCSVKPFLNFFRAASKEIPNSCLDFTRTLHFASGRRSCGVVSQACRFLNTSSLCFKDVRESISFVPPKDEGTDGERTFNIGLHIKRSGTGLFPDEDTPTKLYNGVPYRELPICNVRVSPNNTIITITDYKGAVKLIRSCGIEGFKNTRKGTNVAAQATAISFSVRALEQGFKTVRVRVRGLGPGRMSSIKGLEMGGLDIVSITDNTPVSWFPPRARKQRRL